jgi:hypothetical protein
VEQVIKFLGDQLPTGVVGGGLFGIWLYFRKEYAAIIADLRSTITAQAQTIKDLWAENRRLRGDVTGKHNADEEPEK